MNVHKDNNINILSDMLKTGYSIKYKYKNMIVLRRVPDDYIVWNFNLPFGGKRANCKPHHTHMKSFKMCKKLCQNIADDKFPSTSCSKWVIRSYIRLSENEDYIDKLETLLLVRKNKGKHNYYNRKIKVV